MASFLISAESIFLKDFYCIFPVNLTKYHATYLFSLKRHKLNIYYLKLAEVNEADKMKWKYEQSLSKKAAVIDNLKHEFNKLLINFNNIDDATRLREIMEDPALETKVRFFLFQKIFCHVFINIKLFNSTKFLIWTKILYFYIDV